ncbi:hypothetical protein ACJJTC_010025 [Scirpophaga incertulas]
MRLSQNLLFLLSQTGGDEQQDFHIGRSDGSLTLARRLRWERRAQYTLNVSATDGRHTAYTAVHVTVVNDVHEDGVAFSREQYEVEASEARRVGEALLALAASGAPRLLFGLHAARAPASLPLFRLHETTGVLELAQTLDRDKAEVHELTVWVRDQAPRASLAFARVVVRVVEAAERAPTWGRRLAEARVPRAAAPGALVAALRAGTRRGALRYSLSGVGAAAFTVDAVGDVRLARRLAARGPPDYSLEVRAANAPPRHRAAALPLHVRIVEPDSAPPRFTKEEMSFEIAENAPAGTVVGAVEARSGSSVQYEVRGGAGLLRLSPSAGLLTAAAPLDYEACSFYNLTVIATNMGGGEARAHVAVHVVDVNEHPPVLRRRAYRGRVSEAAAPGALVADADGGAAAGVAGAEGAPLVLVADDADSGAHRRRAYRVLEPAAAALFRLDDTTGALIVAGKLDYETAKLHEFTVRVVDADSPRVPSDSTAKVTVEVTDVNDCAPVFERAAYEATLLRPAAGGALVARVAAADADGPALKYDVIEGDAAGAFALSAAGALTVARPERLPAAAAATVRLRVRASDGRYSATTRVDVRVRDLENAGLAFQKATYYGSVVENSTKPALVAVLNVLGAALNEHIEFHILNPTEGFQVGLTSGAVRTTGVALDREQRDSYELVVEARARGSGGGGAGAGGGGGGRAARATLHVTVTDVNDHCPRFVGLPYAAAVRAGAPPGEPVLRVHAVDLDANDNGEVRYEMKRGHGELFLVDRRSGQISLKQPLEARRAYALVIAAFDGGAPACGAEAAVAVRVWGAGAAPAWERAHFRLDASEAAAPGAPLPPPLRALSPLNRQLIYSIVDDPDSSAHLFEIQFDAGQSPQCRLVIAQLLRSLLTSASITHAHRTYHFFLGKDEKFCFSGTLAARVPLDYESARRHSLVVRATDGVTGAAADAAVTVRVLDANDCAPRLPRAAYRLRVSEAAPPPLRLLADAARDDDSAVFFSWPKPYINCSIVLQVKNGQITYSLSGYGSQPAAPEFSVDPHTGELWLVGALDCERRDAYHLLLVARDNGRPPLNTTAHVFITGEFSVDPHTGELWLVGALDCERRDAYHLLLVARDNGRPPLNTTAHVFITGEFSVDPHTGELWLVGALDCERRDAYHLLLVARDNGRPPLNTTAHVFITGEFSVDPAHGRAVAGGRAGLRAARRLPPAAGGARQRPPAAQHHRARVHHR